LPDEWVVPWFWERSLQLTGMRSFGDPSFDEDSFSFTIKEDGRLSRDL
jgi:hypothetical protein